MTYSFRTNGNFIDFVHTDNTNQMVESVLRSLHNTSRAVEWSLPEDETRINFTVDDLDYRNILITEIDFDDVAMDSQDDFQTGIEAMFPGYAGGGSPGGAVGIDDVLAEEQALTGNRIVDLDGNSLSFDHDGNNMLRLSPLDDNGQSILLSTSGGTTLGNGSLRFFDNDDDGHGFNIFSQLSEGGNEVSIAADATTSTLTYTADSHTFNAPTLFKVTDLSFDLLYIDPVAFNTTVQSNNGTGNSYLSLDANSSYKFELRSYDGTNETKISGDAIAQTITLTALHFNFATLQNFATNAAAIIGGLTVGDLYYTDTAGEAIVKVVI